MRGQTGYLLTTEQFDYVWREGGMGCAGEGTGVAFCACVRGVD